MTYCFKVVNDGEVALFPVEIDDLDLGISEADLTLVTGDDTVPLEPGAELVYAVDAMIDGDLLNTAEATGTPVDEQPPVTSTNTAEVEEVPPVPSILVQKTVLAGHDAACPGLEGTDELVSGVVDTPVTYCFRVVNDGEVALFPVTIADAQLGIATADLVLVAGDDTVPLEPGGELVYAHESTIKGDLVNTVVATGTPVDGQPPVTSTNTAEVVELPPPPPPPPPPYVPPPYAPPPYVPPPVGPPPPYAAPPYAPYTPWSTPPVLPHTGLDLPGLALMALGLALAGVGALAVGRGRSRRRRG